MQGAQNYEYYGMRNRHTAWNFRFKGCYFQAGIIMDPAINLEAYYLQNWFFLIVVLPDNYMRYAVCDC